jgi:uncharacterized protein
LPCRACSSDSRRGATLLLALLWGVWHLPLYGLGFIGPMLHAFFTYLDNRTGSVGLCMLLHGGFTAALDTLILTTDSLTVDLTIGPPAGGDRRPCRGDVVVTRGRLGYHQPAAVSTLGAGERTEGVTAATG